MVRSNTEYAKALALVARGLNDCEIARTTGIPRATIRDWRHMPPRKDRLREHEVACAVCGHPEHDFQALPQAEYAHLLGMYLGDGSIDQARNVSIARRESVDALDRFVGPKR